MSLAQACAKRSPVSFVVIPARLESTRLPRKMLLDATGQPLILHTIHAAAQARKPTGVCVATDSLEIADVVRQAGVLATMTDPTLASGTDRVAAAAEAMPHVEIVVNVQGDEPEIEGAAIDQVIELLENDSDVQMATLATPIRDSGRLDDPACVKVVLDGGARALYFSRAAIPHARSGFESFLSADPPLFYQHIGVYAYRRSFLLRLAQTPPSRIEQIECLEQLRVLESGYAIRVGIVPAAAVGIDTPADYQAFVIRQQRTAA